ncbi:phage tail fiber assembly protein [Citrobacter freundii]|nr:phage tail fiber assembly protein [Citrobacter freundii]
MIFSYFIDTTGKDWYKSLPKFTKKYSLAIEMIRALFVVSAKMHHDFNPGGLTVVDVDSIPAGCNIFGGWVFDGEKVIPRQYTDEELKRQAEEKKQTLLTEASSVISPLERAVRLGMATDEEKSPD